MESKHVKLCCGMFDTTVKITWLLADNRRATRRLVIHVD